MCVYIEYVKMLFRHKFGGGGMSCGHKRADFLTSPSKQLLDAALC